MKKRTISLALVACLLLASLPERIFATDETYECEGWSYTLETDADTNEQYACITGYSDSQTSTTFTHLDEGTTYYFWARVQESDSHLAGTAASSQITALAKTVTSLTVTTQPTKTAYTHGDTFDKTSIVVKATYSDETEDENFTGYTVSYTSGKDYLSYGDTSVTLTAGEGTATVGNLTVNQKALTITGVTAASKEYDGSADVELSGGELEGVVPGETVTLVCTGATGTATDQNVGDEKTVTVSGYTITGTDSGNYTLTQPNDMTVNITAKSISGATITLGADKTYTGSQQTQTVSSVVLGTTNLTDSDCEITSGSTGTDAGEYTLVITGTGTANTTFNIVAANQTPTIRTTANLTKGGNTLDLSTLVGNNKGTVSFSIASGSEYATLSGTTLTSKDTTGTVTINVSITAKDEGGDSANEYNAYSKENAITVTVTDKATDNTTMTVTQSGCTYGDELPDYTLSGVTQGSASATYTGTLRDGTTTYSSSEKPTQAGTYTVTVTYETMTTIYTGTANFTIVPKSIEGATVTLGDGLTYNGNLQTQNVSSVKLGETDITSSCDVTNNTGTNAGTYTLTVTAKDTSNYTGSVTKDFSIAKKAITPTVTVESVTYNGSAQTPAVTVKEDTLSLPKRWLQRITRWNTATTPMPAPRTSL